MQVFQLDIDKDRFEQTNGLWNELQLNAPWSVGYVSSLIESQRFDTKEEWERYYYETGKVRNEQLQRLPTAQQQLLNNTQLPIQDKDTLYSLSWTIKKLNYHYGRTTQQLQAKAEILYDEARRKNIDITLHECTAAVRYRIICQTWNGIVIRERNTIDRLKKAFPSLRFVGTTGEQDHRYAVDYELYQGSELICAIQIKPKSYLGKAPYIQKAKQANQRKNNQYLSERGRPVIDIISSHDGEVLNTEAITEILVLIT